MNGNIPTALTYNKQISWVIDEFCLSTTVFNLDLSRVEGQVVKLIYRQVSCTKNPWDGFMRTNSLPHLRDFFVKKV